MTNQLGEVGFALPLRHFFLFIRILCIMHCLLEEGEGMSCRIYFVFSFAPAAQLGLAKVFSIIWCTFRQTISCPAFQKVESQSLELCPTQAGTHVFFDQMIHKYHQYYQPAIIKLGSQNA